MPVNYSIRQVILDTNPLSVSYNKWILHPWNGTSTTSYNVSKTVGTVLPVKYIQRYSDNGVDPPDIGFMPPTDVPGGSFGFIPVSGDDIFQQSSTSITFYDVNTGLDWVIDATTLTVKSGVNAGNSQVFHIQKEGGIPSTSADITVTAANNPAITTTALAPADALATYNFYPTVTGGVTNHIWSATGLPNGYNINEASGLIHADDAISTNTVSTRIFSAVGGGQSNEGKTSVTLTYTPTEDFLSPVSVTVPFYRFFLATASNGSATMPAATVNQLYDTNSFGPTLYGDYNYSEVTSYYSSNKPTGWKGDTSALGVLDSHFNSGDPGMGINVHVLSTGTITSGGVLTATVSVGITHLVDGITLLPGADTTPFVISRQFTINSTSTNKDFSVANSVIKTTASAKIGVAAFVTNPDNSQWTEPTFTFSSVGSVLFNGSITAPNYSLTWITLKDGIADGDYVIDVSRDGYHKSITVTILHTLIPTVDHPEYISLIDPPSYTLYTGTTGDKSKTFHASINGYLPSAGYYTFNDTDPYLELVYTNGDPNVGGVVGGNDCLVRIKAGSVPPAGYTGYATLDFYSYADGRTSPACGRRAIITVKDKAETLIINPASLTSAVAGAQMAAQTFTTTGGNGNYTYSVTAGVLPTNTSLSSLGLLNGTPQAAGSYSFTVTVVDNAVPPNTGHRDYVWVITAAGANCTLSSVSPSTALNDSGAQITLTGTNFTAPATVDIGLSFTTWGYQSCTNVVVVNPTTITATLPIPVSNLGNNGIQVTCPGSYNYAVKANAINITSNISSIHIDTISPTGASANTTGTITLQGSGFGTGGYINYRAVGGPTGGVDYPATVIGGTNATASGIAFGAQGTATVYFKDLTTPTPNWSNNSKPFTVGAQTLGNLTLNSIVGSATEATAPTTAIVTVTRGASITYALAVDGGTAPYTYTTTRTLPDGLTLTGTGSSPSISGLATPGSQSAVIDIKVTDTNGLTITKWFNLNVTGGILAIADQRFVVRNGDSPNLKVATSGGVTPLTFSKTSGVYCPNLSMDSAGNITGTVAGTQLQSYTFTCHVVDSTSGTPQAKDGQITIYIDLPLSQPVINSMNPNVGGIGGGLPVVLNVTDARTGYVVKFGTVQATVDIANTHLTGNNGTITVITPASPSAGTVNVTLTNTDGSVSNPVQFTYLNIVAPIFILLDKPDGPFIGGQLIAVKGNNFSADLSVFLNNVPCTSVVVNSLTDATFVTPAYTGSSPQTSLVPVDLKLSNTAGPSVSQNAYTYRPPPTITAVVPPTGPSAGGTTIYITGVNFFKRNGKQPRVFIGNVEIDPTKITLVE